MPAILTLPSHLYNGLPLTVPPTARRLMRDLLFMLAPVALITYFLIYPDQFSAFLMWARQLLH